MGDIRLGTSGYCFGSWRGIVYPTNLKDSEMLSYYIDHYRLSTVEVNHTYYSVSAARTLACLARKSPDDFDFTVKLYGGLTHDPCLSGVPGVLDKQLCKRFLATIRPLEEAGKLGCLLAQFPPQLEPSKPAWDYLFALKDALGDRKLVYEFRNKTWVSGITVAALKRMGIGFCAVDGPLVGPLMPLVPEVTSDVAYLRLHGRNKKWFTDRSVRYDYLYSEQELREFVPIIKSMASMSSVTYIQFNNCHAGSALRNVKMMQYLLGLDEPPLQGVLF